MISDERSRLLVKVSWLLSLLVILIAVLIMALIFQERIRSDDAKLKIAADTLAGVNQLLPEGSPVIPQINNVLDRIGYAAMMREIKEVSKPEGKNE